jgi:modulator of FtsH protease
VLRNTYWLLALSMLPTVLGAWIGVSTGITAASGAWAACVFIGGMPWLHVRHRKASRTPPPACHAAGLHLLHGPDALAPAGMVLGFSNGTTW